MKIYQVGGSVRDEILGIPHVDRDFVVVGATEIEFMEKFPSAIKVGKAFPVFLINGEEYAFARIEQKVAPGYHGFETHSMPDVTLEEDLRRRDITINAIAKDPETEKIIDPCNGMKDIKEKRIRHVTDAFAEDPLRVYRVARFAAKFPDFTIDESTIELIHYLKDELETLSPERIWMELEKTLKCAAPCRFFETLKAAELLEIHFPELEILSFFTPGPETFHKGEKDTLDHTFNVMNKLRKSDPHLRFAALCHDLGKAETPLSELPHHYGHDEKGVHHVETLCRRLRIPNSYRKAATMAARYHMRASQIDKMKPRKVIKLLKELRHFPGSGIKGFLELVFADGPGDIEHLFLLAEKIVPILDMKLPEKYQNRGPQSGEILLQLQVVKYKEITGKK